MREGGKIDEPLFARYMSVRTWSFIKFFLPIIMSIYLQQTTDILLLSATAKYYQTQMRGRAGRICQTVLKLMGWNSPTGGVGSHSSDRIDQPLGEFTVLTKIFHFPVYLASPRQPSSDILWFTPGIHNHSTYYDPIRVC